MKYADVVERERSLPGKGREEGKKKGKKEGERKKWGRQERGRGSGMERWTEQSRGIVSEKEMLSHLFDATVDEFFHQRVSFEEARETSKERGKDHRKREGEGEGKRGKGEEREREGGQGEIVGRVARRAGKRGGTAEQSRAEQKIAHIRRILQGGGGGGGGGGFMITDLARDRDVIKDAVDTLRD
eukprot:755528-Hanusia_phi.AAC.2